MINEGKQAKEVTALAAGIAGFPQQLPCVILVIGDMSCYPTEVDKNVIYIASSLASMKLMLAFEILGLSSCPINWPINNMREDKLRQIVKLSDYKKVMMQMKVDKSHTRLKTQCSTKNKHRAE